jgi:ADP-dependent NAD(P)H-hydrate dehydratase / NAD(P)H-hydrate epimerase
LEANMSEMLNAERARGLLPRRPVDGYKGTFGSLLVVAGSINYPGAAALACAGAGRVGAGLVTLATGRSVLGGAGRGPEVTLLPLPEADWGAIGPEAVEELEKHIASYQALVIGPGLGRAEPTGLFIQRMLGLEQPKARGRVGFVSASAASAVGEARKALELPPTVLDADGLNLLAGIEDWPEHMPKNRFVFTPHPGEMRRLLKVDALDMDSEAVARDAAAHWGQVVVLKGATTVIAGPDGATLVHEGNNPALATAGTGDVLAGAIGGLLAQGLALFDAAALGVYLHAAAAGLVRDELGDTGTLASDLLLKLPKAIKQLR